jgi:hypothetical protein
MLSYDRVAKSVNFLPCKISSFQTFPKTMWIMAFSNCKMSQLSHSKVRHYVIHSGEISGLFWRYISIKHGMNSSRQSELARIPGLACLHINSPLEIVYFVSLCVILKIKLFLPVFARFSKAIISNCNALVSSGPASIPYILVSSANSLVLQWMYSNYVWHVIYMY